ncbi:MAG: Gfo/Idh/MocA family oxidoreductase [Clostridiales bacterium]|jgi:predicted dehydrogenase|nr:Gfo/Idh/MocA family oxidoreductase [Clostridiales bacterium]
MKKIKIGVAGIGARGLITLRDHMVPLPDVEVAALCEPYEDRLVQAAAIVTEANGIKPFICRDYQQLVSRAELDAVVVTGAWECHVPVALAAMRAGKYTAIEVGGAYSVEDCWQLVRVSEKTGMPCMMLENCCYGREEMLVLNMARQGLLGEIVHCEGGYRHDLREEVATGLDRRHYRYRNYLHRNCENYPTHELGPIAQILNINRGNRMLSLTSTASKAAGLAEYARRHGADGAPAFAQGDVITTVIKCAHGETITLTLDTTLPRFYSRGFYVQGTKGMYMEDNRSIFLDGKDNAAEFAWQEHWNNVEDYYEQYDHPLWKKTLREGRTDGHGGIDRLVFRAFFDAVSMRGEAPIDVYDTAAWMCITPLSEDSVALGGAPVAIPDFTSGGWLSRAPVAVAE